VDTGEVKAKFRIDVISTYAASFVLVQAVIILPVSYFALVYHHFRLVGCLYAGVSALLVGFVAYAAARHSEKAFYGFTTAAATVLLAWLLVLLSGWLYGAVGAWKKLLDGDFLVHFNRAAGIGMRAPWAWILAGVLTIAGSFAGARAARPVQID